MTVVIVKYFHERQSDVDNSRRLRWFPVWQFPSHSVSAISRAIISFDTLDPGPAFPFGPRSLNC